MFPPYQASGFYHAPVSKGIVGGLVLSSITLNIPLIHWKPWFLYSPDTLFEQWHIWKYLACKLLFLDPKDVMCAAIILYHFRIFERRFGSLKFASYLLGAFSLSLFIETSILYAFKMVDVHLDQLPTGPYGAVYSLFIPYFCDIPRVAMTHLMGVPVTGKSFTYIIGLQMASGSFESALFAGLGLVSGLLIRHNFMWIQKWLRVPHVVGHLLDRTAGYLLLTPTPAEPSTPMGATVEIQRQQHIERLEEQMAWAQLQPRQQPRFGFGLFGNRNGDIVPPNLEPAPPNQEGFPFAFVNRNQNHLAPPPLAQPDEDQVQRLVEMGFNRENILNALQASNNDMNAATNILLTEL